MRDDHSLPGGCLFEIGPHNEPQFEAYHNLKAKQKGISVREHLGMESTPNIVCNYTLGIGTKEKLLLELDENPWPIYKIKTGSDQDLETLKALRNSTNAPFRLDANQGWSLEQAIRIVTELKDHGIEFMEQPFSTKSPGLNLELKKQLEKILRVSQN